MVNFDYLEKHEISIKGEEYLTETAKLYYNSNDSANPENTLKIPTTKDGKEYSIESMKTDQKNVVLAAVMTIVQFLRNNKHYMRNCDELPESSLRAPIMSSHRSPVSELHVSFP